MLHLYHSPHYIFYCLHAAAWPTSCVQGVARACRYALSSAGQWCHRHRSVSLCPCLILNVIQGSTDPAQLPAWSFFISGSFVDHNQGTASSLAPALAATPLGQAQSAAAAQAQQPKAAADRNWTAAMSSIQIRVEDPAAPDEPRVVRWERNRHVGQHKEQIEFHGCVTKLHGYLTVLSSRASRQIARCQVRDPSRKNWMWLRVLHPALECALTPSALAESALRRCECS